MKRFFRGILATTALCLAAVGLREHVKMIP